MKTYGCYSNHRVAARATVYVECVGGELAAIPRRGDRVVIDGAPYVVRAVDWQVFTEPSAPEFEHTMEYPQQHATILVTRARSRQ